jgi:hypothetical protein
MESYERNRMGAKETFSLEPCSMITFMIINTHTNKNGNGIVKLNFDGFRLNEVAHIKIKYLFYYYYTFHKSINFLQFMGF